MAPTLRSRTTATSSSTSYTIARPTGVVEGDVLVLAQFADVGTLANIATPSGWTQLLAVDAASGTNLRGKLWVKTATGSEPSTYGLTQGNSADGVAHLWAIQDGIIPTTAASSTAGTGTTITTPGITPTGSDDLEIRVAAANGGGTARTLTPPAGFTEPSGADINSGGYATAAVGYRALPSGAATSSANWTASGSLLASSRLGFTVTVASPAGEDATAEPEVVQAVASIPAPSVSVGTNATATPSAVAATASIPEPSVDAEAHATATPAVVTATASIPAPDVDDGSVTAPPTLVGVTETTGNNQTVTADAPPGIQIGDLLVAYQTCDYGLPEEMPAPEGGTSWQVLDEYSAGANNLQVRIFWKVAGSEPSSWDFTQASGADGVVLIVAYRGAAATAPTVEIEPGGAIPTANVATPGITAPSDAWVELRFASGLPSGGTTTWTSPAGLDELADTQSNSYTTATAAHRERDTDDATSSETFIGSGNFVYWAGATLGIAGSVTVEVPSDATATPDVVQAHAVIPPAYPATGLFPTKRGGTWAGYGRFTPLEAANPGVEEGDLVLAILFSDLGALSDLAAPDETWTLLDSYSAGTDTFMAKVFWKIATGDEPDVWEFTQKSGSDGVVFTLAYSGADTPPIVERTEAADTDEISTPGVSSEAGIAEIRVAAGTIAAGGLIGWEGPDGLPEPFAVQSTAFTSGAIVSRLLGDAEDTGVATFTASTVLDYAIGYTIGVPVAGESEDATATPDVVEGSASIPAPSASAGSTAAPSTVAASASIPAPAASADSTASPSTITAAASIPAPAAAAGSTASPGVVAAQASIPGATVSTGSTASPSVVEASASVPEPELTAVTTASPQTIQAAATIPEPTPSTGATATPIVVEATASVPAPTTLSGATSEPGVVSATTTIPAPEIAAGSTASPAVVEAVADVPAPDVSAGAIAQAETVEATTTIPEPSVATGQVARPEVVSATAAIPTPTVAYGQTATPGVVAATASIPSPAVQSGSSSTASPETVEAAASIPAPDVSTGAVAQAAVIAAEATIPTGGASSGATASPSILEALASIPEPSTATGATATPGTVTATAEIPAPAVEADGNATAQPAVIAASVSIPGPSTAASSTATPTVVLATAAVPTPTTTVLVAATAQVVEAYATIPAALVSTTARPPVVAAVASIPAPAVDTGASPDLPPELGGSLVSRNGLGGSLVATASSLGGSKVSTHQLGGSKT